MVGSLVNEHMSQVLDDEAAPKIAPVVKSTGAFAADRFVADL
jgi:hypothetical protein